MFDEADEDGDKVLSVEEFKTFLTLEMQNEGEVDLLEVLDNQIVVTSFDWIDTNPKNNLLDWNEVWNHIGTKNTHPVSEFLIDAPIAQESPIVKKASVEVEFLQELDVMATPTRRFRTG